VQRLLQVPALVELSPMRDWEEVQEFQFWQKLRSLEAEYLPPAQFWQVEAEVASRWLGSWPAGQLP